MVWCESEVQSANKKRQYEKRQAQLLRERNLASQMLLKCTGLAIREFGAERAKFGGPGCIARDCNIKRLQYQETAISRDCNIKNGLYSYQYYFGQCPLSDVKENGLCSA